MDRTTTALFDPGSPFPESAYKTPSNYALQKTSFKMNAWFVGLLAYWLIQELALRDPLKVQHPLLDHLFEIVSVLIGSFIAGYMFQLIVFHWPESKKLYPRQREIEQNIAWILATYRDLVITTLTPHPRMKEVIGSVFVRWDSSEPPEVVKLMVSFDYELPSDPKVGLKRMIDPFYIEFKVASQTIQRSIKELRRESWSYMDEELRNIVALGKVFLKDNDEFSDDLKDEDQRLRHLWHLNYIANKFYLYAQKLVFQHSHISPQIARIYADTSYQGVWDEIEKGKSDLKALQEGTGLVPASLPVQGPPIPVPSSGSVTGA